MGKYLEDPEAVMLQFDLSESDVQLLLSQDTLGLEARACGTIGSVDQPSNPAPGYPPTCSGVYPQPSVMTLIVYFVPLGMGYQNQAAMVSGMPFPQVAPAPGVVPGPLTYFAPVPGGSGYPASVPGPLTYFAPVPGGSGYPASVPGPLTYFAPVPGPLAFFTTPSRQPSAGPVPEKCPPNSSKEPPLH
ncbi:hypothetical protein [Paludisphaera mucosa]|uniref:Uncharacterized protein n=1 Tax=Paludisphaera mucosa TaxID=3030827 RepID=A0ABT6FL29_9BACT|nr:hypothetical protein [Paludisphaera mucosa]MDG3008286.1 hypothetical protein [Paludisphaera mucosa]